MGIKGLTDRRARLPVIGYLRKGAPRQDGQRPRDLDHFRFTSDDPIVTAEFAALYGEEPHEITALLPYHNLEECFEAWYEEWRGSVLVHRCDGESCVVWLDAATNTYRHDPRPCPDAGKPDEERRCRPRGRLSVLVHGLWRFGVVVVLTGSRRDIDTISRVLRVCQRWAGGSLQGIPLRLRRRVERYSYSDPRSKRRSTGEKSFIVLEPDADWFARAMRRLMRRVPEGETPPAGEQQGDRHDLAEVEGRLVDRRTGEVIAPVEVEEAVAEEAADEEPTVGYGEPADDEAESPVVSSAPVAAVVPLAPSSRPAPSREGYVRRYQELVGEGKAIGLPVVPLRDGWSVEEITQHGKALRAAIEERAQQLRRRAAELAEELRLLEQTPPELPVEASAAALYRHVATLAATLQERQAALRERWAEVWREAAALGLELEPIAGSDLDNYALISWRIAEAEAAIEQRRLARERGASKGR